ncbi:MAG: hypothetical protein ABSA21_10825 [Candidatus Limnocylindrales bacterium]
MDDRPADRGLPPTTPLRAAPVGRGLPVPPVIPLVAALGLLIGLALGAGLVPKPGPSVASVPTTAAASVVASPLPSSAPYSPVATAAGVATGVAELPPADGLSLAQALVALQGSGMDVSPSAVISARVARYGAVYAEAPDPDEWVWAFVIHGYFPPLGGGIRFCDQSPAATAMPTRSPELCPPAAPTAAAATTEMIVLDYETGAFLVAEIPAPQD